MPDRASVGKVDELVVGRQAEDQMLAADAQVEQRPEGMRHGQDGSNVVAGARRYTPPMGAVETMEVFFEKLNAGDREGAVALMDDMTEMRVHVGDSVQTLRGVERVGGWFLRGDTGLRMIPGEVRDTGNTYEADVLVVRPGRADAAHRRHVPGRGGQDHRDQHRAALGASRAAPAACATARCSRAVRSRGNRRCPLPRPAPG